MVRMIGAKVNWRPCNARCRFPLSEPTLRTVPFVIGPYTFHATHYGHDANECSRRKLLGKIPRGRGWCPYVRQLAGWLGS